MFSTYDRPPAAAELDHLASEAARVRDRCDDMHATAISLTRITDWKARAAVVFHERAEGWARDVANLGALADDVRVAAERARNAAAIEALHGRPAV